ncbi:cadherin domain-containing protein [Microvirga aerophila]|uniref:Cadherin domain-containing protein n=1 Tax=Microvirga aerophila TaxID=670291 RepID=A0A512BTC5_9HYPH|nr:cadherin domain-containing protein [Microvirga aerophila]GEO15165.1 hypothetical protein MAE02_28610 [Microvirga aerophila]
MTNRRSMPVPSTLSATSENSPVIGNLSGDVVRAAVGETVRLDQGLDATVTDLDGNLLFLHVWNTDAVDQVGIAEGDGIVLSGGAIEIDGIHVGTTMWIEGDYWIDIILTENATPALVQRLIRAFTYKSTSTDRDAITRKHLTVMLQDADYNDVQVNVSVVVGPANIQVLTRGEDHLTCTEGADTFVTRYQDLTAGDQIAGGDGNDTLLLHEGDRFDLTRITFTGIEAIAGSDISDEIIISGEQLLGVGAIDGGGEVYNGLHFTGTDINLTGKTITNITRIELKTDNAAITLDNEDLAKKVYARFTQGDKLVLNAGRLDDVERLALHRQGIETIVDGGGRSTTHIAPLIANLGGDQVASTGNTPVLLDAGSNATLSDDDGQFLELKVSVTGRTSSNDVFSLSSSSGVTVDQYGNIRIGDQTVASLFGGSETASEMTIHIDETATEAQVQKLLQSLTYRHSTGALDQNLEIKIELTDVGGRTASHTVTVLASTDPGNTNVAPTNVRLNGDTTVSTPENTAFAAALSATDPDNTTLTFSFDASAAGGGNAGGMFVIDAATKQLKLAPGKTLDFESAQSFTVYVKASDGRGGVSATQALTINVTDLAEVPADQVLAGSSKADRLVGGDGNDRLAGKLGKDVLTGGAGQDRFVFDTKASKTNVDKVTDFTTKADKILLSDTVFKKLGKGTELKPGKIKKDILAFGSKAKDKNDYLVQDKGGVLYHDADGSGRGAKVAIADFDRKISYTDILII